MWQYDSNTVYVPFDVLQKDLGMDAQQAEQDGKPITIPARTSEIHVEGAKPWRDSTQELIAVRDKIQNVVDRVLEAKTEGKSDEYSAPTVRTWEQSQAKWLGAIEKEKVLVIFLFGDDQHRGGLPDLLHFLHDRGGEDAGHRHHQERRRHGTAWPGIFLGYGAGDRHGRRGCWACSLAI